MSKKDDTESQIERIQADCKTLFQQQQKYHLKALAFFQQIYQSKEMLYKSGRKHEKAHALLDNLVKTLTTGLTRKNKNLKSSYIIKLDKLLELKKQMLGAKNQAIVSLMDPLTISIRDLKKQIKQLKEEEDESKNNKS